MRYTIEGFSQAYAMTLKKQVMVRGKMITRQIDCTDLVILRWFVDFYPNMKKIEVDGKQYAWLTHKKLQHDLPIIDISKRSFSDRMQKLVDFEILDYKLVKEGGTFSLYGFGKNYMKMIQTDHVQSNNIGDADQTTQGMHSNNTGGSGSNNIGGAVQPANKDSSINYPSINDSSIKDKSIIYKEIIGFLNEKAGTKYKATSQTTQAHINARIDEGFEIDDFKIVISKKCDDWMGTEWQKYLRPATLFGTKFEGYLNAPVVEKHEIGATGIPVNIPAEEDEELNKAFA